MFIIPVMTDVFDAVIEAIETNTLTDALWNTIPCHRVDDFYAYRATKGAA